MEPLHRRCRPRPWSVAGSLRGRLHTQWGSDHCARGASTLGPTRTHIHMIAEQPPPHRPGSRVCCEHGTAPRSMASPPVRLKHVRRDPLVTAGSRGMMQLSLRTPRQQATRRTQYGGESGPMRSGAVESQEPQSRRPHWSLRRGLDRDQPGLNMRRETTVPVHAGLAMDGWMGGPGWIQLVHCREKSQRRGIFNRRRADGERLDSVRFVLTKPPRASCDKKPWTAGWKPRQLWPA